MSAGRYWADEAPCTASLAGERLEKESGARAEHEGAWPAACRGRGLRSRGKAPKVEICRAGHTRGVKSKVGEGRKW